MICQIPHSIKVTDATQLGQLTGYIITNREVDPLDINYPFIHAMHSVVNTITGMKGYDVDYEWEDIKKEVKVLEKVTELPPKPIDVPEEPKKGLFGGMFKKKKKKTSEPLNRPVNFDSIEDENSVVAEILAASDKKRKQDINNYSEEDEEPISLPKLNLLDDSDLDDLVPVEAPKKKATKTAAKKTTKKTVAESKKAEPKVATKKTVKDVKTTATKQTTKTAAKAPSKAATKQTKTATTKTAVTRPTPKSKVNRMLADGKIMVEGNTYSSITAAAKAYGKVPSTVSRQLKAGKKIKEVFGL